MHRAGEATGPTAAAAGPARRRRASSPVSVLTVVTLAAAVALLAAGQPWALGREHRPIGGVFVAVQISRTGHAVSGAGTAAALLALAAVLAVIAVPARLRPLVGLAVAAAGGYAAVAALDSFAVPGLTVTPWPAVAGAAGVAQLFGGLALTWWSPRWRGLSHRYDRAAAPAAPGAAAPASPPAAAPGAAPGVVPEAVAGGSRGTDGVTLWDALDRGEDPT